MRARSAAATARGTLRGVRCHGACRVGQQQGYAVGAAVYDNIHKASRGWGTIKAAAAADPADGTPRWQVQFEHGQRTTAIKQS